VPIHRSHRHADLGAVLPVATALLAALALAPLVHYTLPPLEDYANHLARLHVIAAGGADPDLARYYRLDWMLVPNLAMDLVVPPIARLVGIYTAGQIFSCFAMASILSGMMVLARALNGRWSYAPLFGLPFLYNYVLLVGTTNYLLGIGLAMWALAAWIVVRRRPLAHRLPVAAGLVLALFFVHLYAVGLFGLGLLAIEFHRLMQPGACTPRQRLLEFCAPGLAFLPVLPLLLTGPTSELAGSSYWELNGKLDGLLYAVRAYSGSVTVTLLATLAAASILAARNGMLRVHPIGWLLLGVGAMTYLAMPRMLFDTYMADQRLPTALLFMLFATVDLRPASRVATIAALALATVLLAIRIAEIDQRWDTEARLTAEFKGSLHQLARGSKVLVVTADPRQGYEPEDFGLVHAASLATIESSALITRNFTVRGKQVMQPTPLVRDLVDRMDGAPPSLTQFAQYTERRARPDEYIYWQRWPHTFDYVYVLFTDISTPNPDPTHLQLLHAGARFHLYRVKPPANGIPLQAAARR
jgi:hypothetical protein